MTDEMAELTFERALEELDALIARLEAGQIPLDEAVRAYERGMALTAHCAALLDRTEATITQLVVTENGSREVPLALDDTPRGTSPT